MSDADGESELETYDMTLSELRSYSSGSMEVVVRYGIGGRSRGDEILSPRFF